MFVNRVTEMLGIDIPIVQAPMGWIARSALASAVSNAGAMGIIETGSGELDAIRDEIARMRDLTDKPFGVNIAQAFVRDDSIVDFVVEQGVRFVTTSAGDPNRYTARLKDAGLTVFHVVPTLKAALKAADAGVDGLIVEGGEGGGYKSPRPVMTMVLLPLVVSKVDLPIVAAGGFMDGSTMAAALALGAEGVQLGTRMVSTVESPIHDNWKQAIVAAEATDTVFLNQHTSPAMRALRTEYSSALEFDHEQNAMAQFGDIPAVYFKGDLSAGIALSGQVAGRIDDIRPVADVICECADDCLAVIADLHARYVGNPPPPRVELSSVADLASGTLTFLFTDLEGSTRLWEAHPEAMQGALAHHDEILRAAVGANGGQIVKATGDGVHAVFVGAEGALLAAHDAQVALDTAEWTDTGPLRVRMGVHTGYAELRDGDYFGTTVNRAARLMAVAHGGQVVTSLATAELVRDDLPEPMGLEYLGEHRLPDLGRAERVYQLTAPDLDDEFPPLRSLDAFPGNLGPQLTSLVGRERELESLGTAMRVSRLVTVTGVGGVGKTRLANHVAVLVVKRFRDGAWFCELAAANDDESMLQVIGAALGVSQHPSSMLEDSILDWLRPKRVLLVLDNCEHLIDDAGRFAESVLFACPGVRILATSREGLGIEGEQIVALRSLSVPSAATTVDAIGASDAVALFVERARSVRADFAIEPGNAAAVAEICRRLDGIPLAIELAAARVVAMTPGEIANLLDERFRLLTGGRRTAVERHQTLRRTVDWSYSLLDGPERMVFDRLGVFAGAFDSGAATAIVAGDGVEVWDVVDALAGLVAKSMVIADESSVETTRYHVLETLRQYARERLEEHGGTDPWRRRHAEYYAAFAEEMAPGLAGPEDWAFRRRVRTELDNLRSAVTWALDSGVADDAMLALRTVAALVNEVSLDRAAGIGGWAERALVAAEHAPPELRSAVFAGAGMKAFMRGDLAGAQSLSEDALRAGLPADLPGVMLAYVTRAIVALTQGEYELAFATVEEGRRSLEDGTASAVAAMLYAVAAIAHNAAGDAVVAREQAEAGVAIARGLRHSSALATALSALGQALLRDDPDASLAALEESQSLVRSGATDVMFANTSLQIARLRAQRGDTAGALGALRDGIRHARDAGDRVYLAGLMQYAAEVFAGLGFPEPAAVVVGLVDAKGFHHFVGVEPEEWDALLEAARRDVGDVKYAEAVARGAAMTLDDAVDFILETLDARVGDL